MKYKVKQEISFCDYSLDRDFFYNEILSNDLNLQKKIFNKGTLTENEIFNNYVYNYLKKIEENITYNPSIDKYQKPRYFNENNNFHIDLYIDSCYRENEYSLYYIYKNYKYLNDFIKTHCNNLGLYYKIGELNDRTFIIFKSNKTHEIKIVGEILSSD